MPPVKLVCALLSTVPNEQGPIGPFQNQETGRFSQGYVLFINKSINNFKQIH